jgi:hypothetical protein
VGLQREEEGGSHYGVLDADGDGVGADTVYMDNERIIDNESQWNEEPSEIPHWRSLQVLRTSCRMSDVEGQYAMRNTT